MHYRFVLSRPENLLRSVNTVDEKLRGTKRLDLFQCTRVDLNVPVGESIAALAKLKSQGKLDHIGMSECSAEFLRRGHKVGILYASIVALATQRLSRFT